MTTRDVFTGGAAVPPGALAELAALRAALPGYDVTITSHSRTHRFEATRRGDGPGPWCLISSDPADLWHELAGRARPAALDGDRRRIPALPNASLATDSAKTGRLRPTFRPAAAKETP